MPQDITDPLQTLPIYTSLFNKLGIAAIACTLIALAVLPLMKKLSVTHSDHATPGKAAGGLRTVTAEE